MNTPGFDFETGYGFVNSYLAVLEAKREGEKMKKKKKKLKKMKNQKFKKISDKDKITYCEYVH